MQRTQAGWNLFELSFGCYESCVNGNGHALTCSEVLSDTPIRIVTSFSTLVWLFLHARCISLLPLEKVKK